MILKTELLEQLEKFHIAKGRIVMVHTSLRAVGDIDGGGETLLSALIEFFTDRGGLLCIPTHTWDSEIYDLRKAESCLGVFPRLAAKHPEALRTLHPTHSMAVFGDREKAEAFAKDESTAHSPASPKGCLGKLYDEDGYVLLIGVGHEKSTFIHCVEEMLCVPNRLTETMVERTVIHQDGRKEQRQLYWFDEETIPDVSENFGKFEPAFRYHGAVLDGQIGNAPAQLCRARTMKAVVELIYRNSGGRELLDNNLPLDEALYKTDDVITNI